MSSFPRSARFVARLVFLALVGILLTCLHGSVLADHLTPLPPPGVIVANTVLSDNGDDDGFADTNETVEMRLTVRNMTGGDLTRLVLLLATDDPRIECITVPTIEIGSLPAGDFLLTEPFVFKVADVNRVSVDEAFSVTFDLIVATAQNADLAIVPTITLELDLDVAAGSGPTTFFEGFESGDLGAFTTMHLDEGLGGSATDRSDNDNSNGYRCQYSDPNWINSNSYDNNGSRDCYLNPNGAPDAFYWQTSVDRAYSGTWSLYFGIPLPALPGFTTPLAQLEAVRTTGPINLGWGKVCSGTTNQGCTDDAQCPVEEACVQPISQLSIKHQISLFDNRAEGSIPLGQAADRAVVHVQVADAAGSPVGDWIKVYPNRNLYDQTNWTGDTSCIFDPIDDGNDEDSFFDPLDPERFYGPSSTCFPALTFVHLGDTGAPFDPGNIGNASDGPGLEGSMGTGSWVESVFDLDRFRGRRVRVRFLETSLKVDSHSWDSFFSMGPTPWDDGWWIDDVQITNTLTSPAIVNVDTKDNSLLPGLTDDDGDGVLCDNCPETANPVQTDSDGDLVGDACDPCPLEFATNDSDADGHCRDVDNCPFTANADQDNVDGDSHGDACDNCPDTVNDDQSDTDGNGTGDACNDFEDADGDEFADPLDNCPAVANPSQHDGDGDSLGHACDNCPADYNPSQMDGNSDGEGDLCDLNDNLIYITFSDQDSVDWQEEVPFVAWNSYRGDLDTLKTTGIYTQVVGSNPLAAQVCGLTDPFLQDPVMPAPGAAAFYLTTGVLAAGSERSLGTDSSGNQRPNTNPCP